MNPYFDSRDKRCKEPFGAVAAGTAVHFALQDESYYGCELLVRREFAGAEDVCPLPPAEGGFAGSYTAPGSGELCWYGFRLTDGDGRQVWFGKNGLQDAPEKMARWQLTVYEPTPVPSWFGEGVTYQIFPDRFRRVSLPDVSHMVGRRWLHSAWEDEPVYLPEENGEVTNRDFFGGSLPGITEKLDYLKGLHVTTLYLNPIFEAASNHRYDTADYRNIDPLLGTEEDFRTLCREAHERGMRVIVDGVFNHTGSNSRYFNAEGYYPELGAAQSRGSPYFGWYSFHPWPAQYDAWWGVRTLPAVNEERPDYRDFIFGGADSVVRRWLRCGADGWRLDVADELPDGFIEFLRKKLKSIDPEGVLLGEVWEEATNKHSMGGRRKYVDGHELDSVMDYPFRRLLMDFFLGRIDGEGLARGLLRLMENYPPQFYESLLNLMGSHDVVRAITALAGAPDRDSLTREQQAAYSPTIEQLDAGRKRFMAAAAVQYMMPGAPCLYYGDEAGLTGMADPFNRGTYPWGQEDTELIAYFQKLGELHKRAKGGCAFAGRGDVFALYRPEVICMVNRSCEPVTACFADKDFCGNIRAELENGCIERELPPYGAAILIKGQEERA